jgi:hypothetical protein
MTACTNGYTKLIKFCIDHREPTGDIPDELAVAAAKHGQLEVLELLSTYGMLPRASYREAFSWGHMQVCKYIQSRHPDYHPENSDILKACQYGHMEAIASLPEHTVLPDECMEKAVKSMNPKLIYLLSDRMPNYEYKMALLNDAMHTRDSDVCIAVFDCGKYRRLPANYDTVLAQNQMRKALQVFHTIGFVVYTEKAFVEACRNCSLEIIRDILESSPFIQPDVWHTALCAIQVSPEIRQARRIEAFDYVNRKFKESLHDHETSLSDDAGSPKRLKHVHGEAGK